MRKITALFLCLFLLPVTLGGCWAEAAQSGGAPDETPFERFSRLEELEVRAKIVYERTSESSSHYVGDGSPPGFKTGTADSYIKHAGRSESEWRGVLRHPEFCSYGDDPEYSGKLEAEVSSVETSEYIDVCDIQLYKGDPELASSAKSLSRNYIVSTASGHYPGSGGSNVRLLITPEGYTFEPPGGYMDMPGKIRRTWASRGSATGLFWDAIMEYAGNYDDEDEGDTPVSFSGSETFSMEIKKPLPDQGLTLTGREVFTEDQTFPEGSNHKSYTVTYTIGPVQDDDDFKAVPVVASKVLRGQNLQLDGTASRGDIEEYIWTLAPRSADAQVTTKLGPMQELFVLDDLDVTLTVTGGGRFSSESVSVTVEPRSEFETEYWHEPEEGLLDGTAHENVRAPEAGRMFGKYELLWLAGENVCAIDPPRATSETTHFLHPNVYRNDGHARAGVKKDTLFDLEQVWDPDGPWHQYYFFTYWKMYMDRMNLINPHLLPTAPPIEGSGENFYQINKREGTDVDGYLASVRRHETTHSLLAFEALKEHDPGPKIEKSWGADRKKLEDDAFEIIVQAERDIWNHSKDPLPDIIWQGNLALRLRTTGELGIVPCEMLGVRHLQP